MNTEPITRFGGRPTVFGAPAAGTSGNCQGPAFGSALNRPSEIGVALAVTGIPTAEVTARSARSMECLPSLVTSQSLSLYDTSTPWSGRIGPTEPSVTNGRTITDVSTVGATLSGLVTVSHNVHIDSRDTGDRGGVRRARECRSAGPWASC